jgi:Restriction Endonuclease associating with ARP
VRSGVLPFEALLDEPIYQLVRQQLLAWELEKTGVHDVDRVRVVHVMPSDNVAYGESLRPKHREVGDTVHEVWHALLRRSDRFLSLDSSVFADADITSQGYVDRYGEKDGSHDQ